MRLGLDRTFSLELAFVNEKAEPLAMRSIHAAVLDALPNETTTKQFSKVLLALQEIKSSPLCMACGPAIIAEVDGVHSMVSAIDEAIGIEGRDILNFSEFYKKVVSKLLYFCERVQAASGIFKKTTLLGRAAIQDLYQTVSRTKADGGQVSVKATAARVQVVAGAGAAHPIGGVASGGH